MTSLNPVMTIGEQIAEAIRLHQDLSDKRPLAARRSRCCALVRIPEPAQRAKEYPHQLSGGMRQRAMIAMALACNPKVLIADEPTTALDVTIQAQILDLILELQRELGTAVILITHDLGVVAETAQRVIVMYAGPQGRGGRGRGRCSPRPLHPYTHGLMASIPRLALMRGEAADAAERLQEIPGMVPALTNLPAGCVFAPRCAFADDRCRGEYPPYEEKRPGHWAACWRSDELYGAAMADAAQRDRWRKRRSPVLEVTRPQEAFPDQEGAAAAHRRPGLCRRRRQLLDRAGRDARPGRRIRLRQVHRRPHRLAADRADRRHDQARRRRHHASRQGGAAAATGGRCRSSSRTRSPRSIRACRRATSSASRCGCTASRSGRAAHERVAELFEQVGLRPAQMRQLSAPVLRRPAPAHRHRARARAASRS